MAMSVLTAWIIIALFMATFYAGYLAGRHGHDPLRSRKLLLHRREIDRLISRVQERGYTIVPLKVYLKHGRAKVEIGLARGKRRYDKRASIAKLDSQRQIERALKDRERS